MMMLAFPMLMPCIQPTYEELKPYMSAAGRWPIMVSSLPMRN
mgnify:FL=1